MEKNSQKGFTLIELLVVIAIIGILASVVLASLNSARNKGSDAAVKANLANARAQAELYYDNTANSYTALCTAAGGITTLLTQANTTAGGTAIITAIGTVQGATESVCHENGSSWISQVPLKQQDAFGAGSGQDYYCVDSSGASKVATLPRIAGTASPAVLACI